MEIKVDFDKCNDNCGIIYIANEKIDIEKTKKSGNYNRQKLREKIEPWLTAVFQSEHLSLLVGSGLSMALTTTNPPSESTDDSGDDGPKENSKNNSMMSPMEFKSPYMELIKEKAEDEAIRMGRGKANFEDYLRVALDLLKGYKILRDEENYNNLQDAISEELKKFVKKIIKNERTFLELIAKSFTQEDKKHGNTNPLLLLKKFLLSFSTRTATKDRLNIFTTNYDRFIEFGLDEAGILTLDRFIGKLKPIMRFHRIDLDYHYNPPGIRGEPRYVEGVVRFTKLHGSLDWQFDNGKIVKIPLLFGQEADDSFFKDPLNKVVIYPNSQKDIETTLFPYSELFRDFSTAVCRPNSVLVTYGYGFGDSHINNIIKDMLTIPSTHLVIISYDFANGRIKRFVEQCNESQLTLLIGKELGTIENLTNYYLPKPAIDRISDRQFKLLEKRSVAKSNTSSQSNHEAGISEKKDE